MIPIPGRRERDFTMRLRTAHNLKLMNCLFLEFSTNFPFVAHGSPRVTETEYKGGLLYNSWLLSGSTAFAFRASNPAKRFSSCSCHCHPKEFNKNSLRGREWGWLTIEPSLCKTAFHRRAFPLLQYWLFRKKRFQICTIQPLHNLT